jgi:Tfp pilus assembly protein PilF
MARRVYPEFSEQQPVGLIVDKQMHERALLKRPNSLKIMAELAGLCIELEDMQGANAYIDKIQGHIDYSPAWMLHVAKLHFRVQQYHRALETLQELPKQETNNLTSW